MPGNGQPGGHEPPPPRVPPTRAQAQRPAEKSREELVNANKSETEIFNASQGRAHLEKHGYVTRGNETTANTLATILLQLTQCSAKMPRAATEGMRAVAFMLEEVQSTQVTETITTKVLEALNPIANKLAEATEEMRATTVSQANTMEEFRAEAHEVCEAVTSAVQELADQAEKTRVERDVLDTQGATPATAQHPTYATITQVHTPPRHAEVIARAQGRERQVLIEWGDQASNNTADLTERELVAKANEAVELMGGEPGDCPEEGNMFIGAQRLQRGGILYLMTSAEAANWVRQPETRTSFLDHFGGIAVMRERGHNTVVEYVPVQFNPQDTASLRVTETINQLPEREILSARWIKDVSKRTPGQRTAFVLMTLRTAKGANQILREGIVIEGKRVYGRKNVQEARRCLKCQGYQANHRPADCKQIHDTCARCAKMHRTNECAATPSEYHCSNCNKKGHAASDRSCPVFVQECTKLLKRYPENKYCYFPTKEDPTSWELVEGAKENAEPRTDAPHQESSGMTGEWQTIRYAQRGAMAGLRWNGGARGGGAARGREGRPTDFVAPPRDNGWNGRGTGSGGGLGSTQRETNTWNPEDAPRSVANPPTNTAPTKQTTLDEFMQANPPSTPPS